MITNETKGTLLAKSHRECRSMLSKAKGFMFSRKKEDYGLVFEFRKESIISIHNLFVFFPIDILWLDRNRKVVDMKKGFKPFSPLILPKAPAMYVIETAAGAIDRSRTETGDRISW